MAAQPTTAPVLSGPVPPLAAGFHARQETGFGLADGLRPGETILLVPAQGAVPDGGLTAAGVAGGATGGTAGGTGNVEALLSQLIEVMKTSPGQTGGHVSQALNGVSRNTFAQARWSTT